ncbi:rhodanese-like domain-containing protein [Methylobacter sp.]|uniref:rhodanese-like domain-containing protein n=1 Tax=Methylobacter sp. TaxID=2051955 RepID=UPI002FDD9B15
MKIPSKLILFLMILVTPVAFGAAHDHDKKSEAPAAATEYKYKTPKLNRAQFDALLANPEQLVIIDVRRPDELSTKGGFPVYLSIQAKEIENSIAFIPKDRSIVTVSNHAGRAGAAADLLSVKGFKVVGAVGAQNYEQEGGKLTKVVPPEPKK